MKKVNLIECYHGTNLRDALKIGESRKILSPLEMSILSRRDDLVLTPDSTIVVKVVSPDDLEALAHEGLHNHYDGKVISEVAMSPNFDEALKYAKRFDHAEGGVVIGVSLDQSLLNRYHRSQDGTYFVPKRVPLDGKKVELFVSPAAKRFIDYVREAYYNLTSKITCLK